jgi:hypothetical protein
MPRKPKKSGSGEDNFAKLLKQITKVLLQRVNAAMGTTPWTLAFLIERQCGVGSPVRAAKLRVQVPRKKELKWLAFAGANYGNVMDKVWELKDEVFAEPWYTLKLTFYPDGRFETEYDCNPNCPPDFYTT